MSRTQANERLGLLRERKHRPQPTRPSGTPMATGDSAMILVVNEVESPPSYETYARPPLGIAE